MSTPQLLLLSALIACSDPVKDAETDTTDETAGEDSDTDTPADTTDTWTGGDDTAGCEPGVSDVKGWAVVESSSGVPTKTSKDNEGKGAKMSATSPSPGVIDVLHTGVVNEFCYNFCVSSAWSSDSDLHAFYSFGSEAAPDEIPCEWDLTYRLSGVPAGTWTLGSQGDSAVVKVQ